MGRISTFGQHLYSGRVSFDFVGRRRMWYAISAVIVLLCAVAFVVRGFHLGIEFKGGVEFTAQVQRADAAAVDDMTQAVVSSGVDEAGDPIVNSSGSDAVRVQTAALTQDQATAIEEALTAAGATEVSQNLVGPSWGKQVGQKAFTGLMVFLVVVVLFIWAYFREWKMSVAALVALAHDLLITAGIYAWSGFEVTPATVTGLLTILGYSLYDTVVVFDKVRENTRDVLRSNTRTYAERANLAVNQTLVRSINTSVTALLPVAALLLVGTAVLGTGPLKDLALALFVGMAAGTYSSICIATPLAVQLKEREPALRAHTARVLAKRGTAPPVDSPEEAPAKVKVPAGAAATAAAARPVASSGSAKRNQPTRTTRANRPKGRR
ncbi:protein translocase subunit SecF [Aeromicrobium sp.]|uniref:protein translocase subunit SecF n=1 Tax=Aeromicrobium sp. TaxID=1871063 RepID=UPI003D6C44EA